MFTGLMLVIQSRGELLWNYIKRLNKTYADINDPNENFVIQTFKVKVKSDNMHYTLHDDMITMLHELLHRAQSLTEVEKIHDNQTRKLNT